MIWLREYFHPDRWKMGETPPLEIHSLNICSPFAVTMLKKFAFPFAIDARNCYSGKNSTHNKSRLVKVVEI